MKTIFTQDTFKAAIARAQVAVAGKSTLPVLSNLLLETDQERGRLVIKATDLDVGVITWLPARTEVAGAISLPAKLLADVVGSLPNDQITLTTDARTQSAKLVCGSFTTNIKGIEADEFPSIPSIANVQAPLTTLSAAKLGAMLDQVAPCAAADDSRPVLAGVLLRLRGQQLALAAADGFRLAFRTHILPYPFTIGAEHIIPAKSLRNVGKVLGAEGDVTISISSGGSHAAFTTDAATLVTRLIDGTFPDVERIIPAQHRTRTIAETAALAKAVKLASYFASSSQNVAKLQFQPGGDLANGAVVISANAAEVGDNTGEADATISGEGGQIALNVSFLAEALGMMGTAQVAIETQTPQSPAVLRPVGEEGYVHVIMPMSIR